MGKHPQQQKLPPKKVPLSGQIFKGVAVALLLVSVGLVLALDPFKLQLSNARPDREDDQLDRDAQLDREALQPPRAVSIVNIWSHDPTRTPDGGYVPKPIRPTGR